MALTKGRQAITQLSSSGTSDTLDISGSYKTTLYIEHNNGSGTISAGASILVQVRPDGASEWYDYVTIPGSTTSSDDQTWTVDLPDDAGDVQIIYTEPTDDGTEGQTLDAEVGKITAI